MDNINIISDSLGYRHNSVKAVLDLLADGSTVPFIARYRKEQTGSLDEVAIAKIRDTHTQILELSKRRNVIIASLSERDLYKSNLKNSINNASSLKELEDLYLPYRLKRRTRATIAKENGLQPLADSIFNSADISLLKNADEQSILGARDIIAEKISENTQLRKKLRELYATQAILVSKVVKKKTECAIKYKDYFEWSENASKVPSHRFLAILRGESEGFLKVQIRPAQIDALRLMQHYIIKSKHKNHPLIYSQIKQSIEDAYKRLLAPSMETELRSVLKENADEDAIKVFTDNLRELLMAPPLGQKAILAIDPGFRTGCKVVCLNPQGKLLYNTVIYPQAPKSVKNSEQILVDLVDKYMIEAIAIGNGTASRETESFVRQCNFKRKPIIVQVNESGASIYSASDIARAEFPNDDITVRGAVSIGRRLADPLAELVKLDPKSIGVGQYQHDVDQHKLKKGLDDTVVSCVNAIGVELNTASAYLLSYVSGLGMQLAQNIVDYRNENGAFTSKAQLKKVKRLGPKAFEQSAGFLRIHNAKNPLDSSGVHPERYPLIEQICKDYQTNIADLMQDATLRSSINLSKYITNDVGLPTLKDIIVELSKPGRDPRQKFELFSFATDINTVDDLKKGMRLPGIVTNVTNFGAFVDVGVHQDGLVHISQLADKFVKDPSAIVKVGQKVKVWVCDIDKKRARIALSLRSEYQCD